MLRIWIHEFERSRKWTEIWNGPFPNTRAQLDEARRRFQEEWKRMGADDNPMAGIRLAPQTTARAILDEVCPGLDSIDKGMIGFAVSNPRNVKTEEE